MVSSLISKFDRLLYNVVIDAMVDFWSSSAAVATIIDSLQSSSSRETIHACEIICGKVFTHLPFFQAVCIPSLTLRLCTLI